MSSKCGYYWIRIWPDAEWEVARWTGDLFCLTSGRSIDEDFNGEIGPRIEPPGETK